jgi:peptidoglycan lytic transglycosylase B
MRILVSLLVISLSLLAAGCGSSPTKDSAATARPEGKGYGSDKTRRAARLAVASVGSEVDRSGGGFSGNPSAERFVRHMELTHGFDPNQLRLVLARAQKEDWIIEAMDRPVRKTTRSGPPTPTGAWTRYRAKFVTPDNIEKGAQFWRQYASALEKASARYGVPPEIIVGIIGVETRWGRVMGKTRIVDALATLAFAYPRRAEYFTGELENFLIMARDEGFDPFKPTGSFAGAMGYGQFMPSSFHRYAVDFTGDGHRDLWNPVDAIGSVANYFKGHGWRAGEPVAVRATATGGAIHMKTGFDTRYSLGNLAASGITPTASLGRPGEVSLLRLDAGSGFEYWVGLHNFYVITRYNHSTYYAMAVYQLGKAVKARVGGLPGTRVAQELEGAADATL